MESIKRQYLEKLVSGVYDICILSILKQHPNHGYGIKREFKKKFGVSIGYGSIYRKLREMEESGLLKKAWDLSKNRPKKVYAITGMGIELHDYLNSQMLNILSVGINEKEANKGSMRAYPLQSTG